MIPFVSLTLLLWWKRAIVISPTSRVQWKQICHVSERKATQRLDRSTKPRTNLLPKEEINQRKLCEDATNGRRRWPELSFAFREVIRRQGKMNPKFHSYADSLVAMINWKSKNRMFFCAIDALVSTQTIYIHVTIRFHWNIELHPQRISLTWQQLWGSGGSLDDVLEPKIIC